MDVFTRASWHGFRCSGLYFGPEWGEAVKSLRSSFNQSRNTKLSPNVKLAPELILTPEVVTSTSTTASDVARPIFLGVLRSEIPSGMCAKLRTVAASNDRDHARNLSYIACSHHGYIFLFFAHIPFVVNHTINATPQERLQQGEMWLEASNSIFVWDTASQSTRWLDMQKKWRRLWPPLAAPMTTSVNGLDAKRHHSSWWRSHVRVVGLREICSRSFTMLVSAKYKRLWSGKNCTESKAVTSYCVT